MSEGVVGSFALWFAVVTGALPLLDRTTLRMALPDYLWVTWQELLDGIRYKVDDEADSGLLMVALAVIESHPWQKGSDEIRKPANADPTNLVKILNLDETVTWRGVGKANMAWMWLWNATYVMHAGRLNQRCSWEGVPNAEGFPSEMGVSGDKLTHAVKAALPLARPQRPLVAADPPLSLSLTAPIQRQAGINVGEESGPSSGSARQPSAPPAAAP